MFLIAFERVDNFWCAYSREIEVLDALDKRNELDVIKQRYRKLTLMSNLLMTTGLARLYI